MIINSFLKTSSIYFYSVNVTYTSAQKLYLLHCCSLLVALESLPFPRERAEPCTISTHPTPPWQLPSCRKGTCSPWKGGPPTATFSFPGSKMWALHLVAPGAEKRGEIFCTTSSHTCSHEKLHLTFAREEPSPGLCFSKAEESHLLW